MSAFGNSFRFTEGGRQFFVDLMIKSSLITSKRNFFEFSFNEMNSTGRFYAGEKFTIKEMFKYQPRGSFYQA